jgi:site-specific DNA-methyltransferase (adenine-specific)
MASSPDKAHYRDDWVTIYHADCREMLPSFAPGSFDVAFADPPYGVGFDYGNSHADTWNHSDLIGELRRVAATVLVTPGIRNLWDWPRLTWAIAWAKPGSTRRSDLGGFNEWEPVLIYGKPRRMYHDLRLLPSVANLANGDTGDHPCPKPLTLLRWLLAETSMGGTVLDPFMGSGTTLRAAKDQALQAVGIDVDAHFCDIAARRMAQEVLGV